MADTINFKYSNNQHQDYHSQQQQQLNPSLYIQKTQSDDRNNNIEEPALLNRFVHLNKPHSHQVSNYGITNQQKLNSPSHININNVDQELTRMMYEGENGFFNMSQVLASSESQSVTRTANTTKQRSSKSKKKAQGDSKIRGQKVAQAADGQQILFPIPQHTKEHQNDQHQSFNISGQMFHPAQTMNQQQYVQLNQTHQTPMLQQPSQQIQFIANQQKFYQISPSRGCDAIQVTQVPILFDKRPYTQNSIQQVMSKRSSANKVQSSAIAALYLANTSKGNPQNYKPSQLPASNEILALAAQSTSLQNQFISSQLNTPYTGGKKRGNQNLSQPRKNAQMQAFAQMDHEQLFEEATRLKQQSYDLKDEIIRLKARLKQNETEILRKDKVLDDFYHQNQHNTQQKSKEANSHNVSVTGTNQKQQQQDNLVITSLKKQIKQMKSDLGKRDEYISQLIKESKHSQLQELEQETQMYKDEIMRLRDMIQSHQESQKAISPNEVEAQDSQHQIIHTRSSQQESKMAYVISQNGRVKNHKSSVMTEDQLYEPDARLIEKLEQKESLIIQQQQEIEFLTQQIEDKIAESQKNNSNQIESLKSNLDKNQQAVKEFQKKLQEQNQIVEVLRNKETLYEQKINEYEKLVKGLQTQMTQQQNLQQQREDMLAEKETQIQSLEKKVKSLKDTILEIQNASTEKEEMVSKEVQKSYQTNNISTSTEPLPPPSKQVQAELNMVTPILAANQKITDRLTLVAELKQGLTAYTPSVETLQFIKETPISELALSLPSLNLPKARLDNYQGEVGERIQCDFTGDQFKVSGESPTLEQRQYLMGRYLTEIVKNEVFINSIHVQADLNQPPEKKFRKKSVDEEQMLDIAEMCFIRMADIFIKQMMTVREAFSKYAVPETLPESKAMLELLPPNAFLEAIKIELGIKELTDLEIACLMRVLAKPELGNAIILNEFALIMENFGVPLVDGTLSDEEDYCPDGQDKPLGYDLKNIDIEGIQILEQVARYLLKEYQHPREFFGKSIKNNQQFKTEKKTFHVDVLQIKEFYLKIKIANIRKTLAENQSLNKELCLDPVAHPTLFNVKYFIRALEDIAEIEQQNMFDQEKALHAGSESETKSEKNKEESSPAGKSNKDDPEKLKDSPVADYSELLKPNVEIKSEIVKFGKGSGKSARSPNHPPGKFQALGTIDEVINETVTSHQIDNSIKDDDSKTGYSNNMRNSRMIDFEESVVASQQRVSTQRVEKDGSLSIRRDESRNPKLGKSIDILEQNGVNNSEPMHTEDGYHWSAHSGKSEKGENQEVSQQQDYIDDEIGQIHDVDDECEQEEESAEQYDEDYENNFE